MDEPPFEDWWMGLIGRTRSGVAAHIRRSFPTLSDCPFFSEKENPNIFEKNLFSSVNRVFILGQISSLMTCTGAPQSATSSGYWTAHSLGQLTCGHWLSCIRRVIHSLTDFDFMAIGGWYLTKMPHQLLMRFEIIVILFILMNLNELISTLIESGHCQIHKNTFGHSKDCVGSSMGTGSASTKLPSKGSESAHIERFSPDQLVDNFLCVAGVKNRSVAKFLGAP